MSLSAAMNISLSGMQAQQTRMAATANNVANAMTPRYDRLETRFSSEESGGVSASVSPSGADTSDEGSNVDLAQESLSLIESEIGFKANASAWETGADMWDVLMSIKRD
ncbi:flagellar basal body rod protein [Rhizobium sp. Root274]|uniref:flagellar basal body protein n=1 Tax=unclassified Rhizobium TaxID=2613769 RepID=UPI000714D97D|nr:MULTISPECIES: flagellar basal body protein [unclassified Rhizobium]KQW27504.1 flagellar basal body rod protein [Rhizobium sp. Root1240]KRD27740.1 flagellar basal body rod protein [Rhizobium sp. Root274]